MPFVRRGCDAAATHTGRGPRAWPRRGCNPLRTSRSRKVLALLAVDRLPWPERESEEGKRGVLVLAPTPAVFAVDDPCLVGMEPQSNLVHPLRDPGQHRLGLCPAFAVHDGIVSEAVKRAARILPGHPRIERVVHEQVRQARRDRRPLRSSPAALFKGPVRMLQRRMQPPFHVEQHPPAVGDRLHRPDDQVPRHLVEELLDVQVDRPVVLPAPLPAYRKRVMGRASRPVAIGVLVKPGLSVPDFRPSLTSSTRA